MKFSVDPLIFRRWPDVKIGVLVVTDMDNAGHSKEVLALLRQVEKEKKEKYGQVELGKLPEVEVWRTIYREFGSKPKKYKSSVESLLRRARGGEKPLPQINNLVDIYNYISLKYHLPAGAEDIDKTKGDIKLGFAKGTEIGKYIGAKVEDTCYEGEVIYKDDVGFICRRWNWREADRTKIDERSKNAVLVIEKAPGVDENVFQKALEEAKDLLTKFLKAKVDKFILDFDTPFFEIDFQTGGRETKEKSSKKKTKDQPKFNKTADRNKKIQRLFSTDKNSIDFQLKQIVSTALTDVVGDKVKKLRKINIFLEHPNNFNYGDFSTNIALIFAKELKTKPKNLAKNIADKINDYIRTNQSITYKTDSKSQKVTTIYPKNILEKVNVAGSGFINLFLSPLMLITLLQRLLKLKKAVISTQTLNGKRIMIEYTDPNPFKQLHIGHLYSNTIGESFSCIFESLGASVWRADFYGDVGMHIAKSIWGMMKKMKEENINISNLEEKSLLKRQEFLGEGYALGVRAYEESEEKKEEIKDLNYFVYIASQEVLKKDREWKPIVDYRKYIKGRLDKLDKIQKVYEAGLKWSLDYFEEMYKRIGTKFDGYYPESWTGELGMKLVEEGLKKGVLEKSDKTIIYRGEKDGLHTRVFVNQLGLPTYEAKDLGLVLAKHQDFVYDLSINVYGKEIEEYSQVVLCAITKIRPDLGKKSTYLTHGMINLPEGKMSSRTGNVVTVKWVLDETKKQVQKILEKSSKNASSLQSVKQNVKTDSSDTEEVKDQDYIAEKVAQGAVKYAFLKSNIGQNITFDFQSSVSLEGDSGPYLMYTYARCRSVLRKSKTSIRQAQDKQIENQKQINSQLTTNNLQLNAEELILLRTLYRFEEVVIEAAKKLSPHLICSFLYDLAQKYNNFYAKHKILTNNRQTTTNLRLALTLATANVVRKGLSLLGIQTVEKM